MPQPGHFPSHRPEVVPHSAQVNWTVTFATRGDSLGTGSDAVRHETRVIRLQLGGECIRVPWTAADTGKDGQVWTDSTRSDEAFS